jgi:deoxyribose-phosphate aldolase
MSVPSTDAEWAELIVVIEKQVDLRTQNQTTSRVLPQDAHTLAQFVDHTLLKLDATESQIDTLCEEAAHHDFKVGLSL